jgi:sterol desaturase/sphingolipid hydroxylase (fatty acid hydroxylase superfamily)
MSWESIETFLRRNDEPLQYAAFFGALALFGVLELVAARRREDAARWRRWPANWGLTVLNILLLGALPLSGLAVADLARERGWGLLNHPAVPLAAAIVAGFLLRALVSWVTHLAMHKVPLLWRVHRVHHTDTVLDVSTTVRFHPLEFAIQVPIMIGATLALGLHPAVVIAYEIIDAGINVFTHSNVRLPAWLDRALRLVLVTPDMHRVHHSMHRPQTDSNYGAVFSIWDRAFGTYRRLAPQTLAGLRLGLEECCEQRARSLPWLLALPFRHLGAPASEARRVLPAPSS